MFSLLKNWLDLFRRDRLLADKGKFYRGLAVGVMIAALLFLTVALLMHRLWPAALVAGLAGGALQPFLFRDLRYR